MADWQEVGRRIKRARGRRSIRSVAKVAGRSEGWWRQLENGQRIVAKGIAVPMNVRDENLEAAALAVDLDPGPLFELVGRVYVPSVSQPEPEDLNRLSLLEGQMAQLLASLARLEERLDMIEDGAQHAR